MLVLLLASPGSLCAAAAGTRSVYLAKPEDQPLRVSMYALRNAFSAVACSLLGLWGRKTHALSSITWSSERCPGKSTSNTTSRSPRPPPGSGRPSPCTSLVEPVLTISVTGTVSTRPSSAGMLSMVPLRAFTKGILAMYTRSDPLREKIGCSATANVYTTGPGCTLGASLPSLSKTYFVPVAEPGFMSTVSVRSYVSTRLSAVSTFLWCDTFFNAP
mmetsp:Transcript_14759/g.28406  ORF Transcript_14759/g.28406 Transcript_14759/m.28406 type:complete len:216 (+) Transcript_14759:1723-2370(+)